MVADHTLTQAGIIGNVFRRAQSTVRVILTLSNETPPAGSDMWGWIVRVILTFTVEDMAAPRANRLSAV